MAVRTTVTFRLHLNCANISTVRDDTKTETAGWTNVFTKTSLRCHLAQVSPSAPPFPSQLSSSLQTTLSTKRTHTGGFQRLPNQTLAGWVMAGTAPVLLLPSRATAAHRNTRRGHCSWPSSPLLLRLNTLIHKQIYFLD